MRRELNEIEYFNWCVGQPYNMVVAVRLTAAPRPEALSAALAAAQRRHPLLGVNTEPGAGAMPWFSSEGVGAIPLEVVEAARPGAAERHAEREVMATFAMDGAGRGRLPLIRAALFLPPGGTGPAGLVFTVQHVVADGLSMVFLLRDLQRFMATPAAPLEVLDAPASDADLFPIRVRRRIPTSPLRFRAALWLARAWVLLRFGGRPPVPARPERHRLDWTLTGAQTVRLRERCRREGVSVQTAVCTAFLPGFRHVHTPVNLRALLARPVGEAVGLYVGAAEVRLRYRPAQGFWENARRFHRRLRRAQRDPFGVFRLFSKAVPVALVRQLGPLLVRLAGGRRPLAVTNLGELDGHGLAFGEGPLGLESFSGAVTPIVDSSVVTAYTLGGRLRLDLLATEEGPGQAAVREEAERSVARLLAAAGE
jgi:hypothetical protein